MTARGQASYHHARRRRILDIHSDPLLAPLEHGPEGVRAGDCVLTEKLGQGGMGAVYLAWHENLHVEVAVKVLPFHVADTDSTAVERFRKEARAAVRIDHPNIVRVFDVKQERGVHYLVMEHVDGESADARLKREGPLPERDALEIAVAAGEALSAAHAKGILHRDVKPSNILIRYEDGRVKVADLGLAKALGAEAGATGGLTATGAMLGTPAYMSPEQAEDASRADERSDVYSLGATLYALLSGKAPFEASQLLGLLLKVRGEEPRDLRGLRPELSEKTAGVVRKLMAKKADARPRTMKEALGLLRESQADSTESELGLARPQMAGKRKIKIALGEIEPTPAAKPTLDDVTPEKLASERRAVTVGARMSAGRKIALALGIVAVLAAALAVGGYLNARAKRVAEAAREEAETRARIEVLLDEATSLRKEGNHEEVSARAVQVLVLDASNMRAKALMTWAKSEIAREKSAADHRELGYAHRMNRKYREAISELKKAAELLPGDPVTEEQLAFAYLMAGQEERAAAHASRAIALGTRTADTYWCRAAAYHKMGELDKSLEDVLQAHVLAPNDRKINDMLVLHYMGRAHTESEDGRHAGAINYYSRAIELRPNDPSIYYFRGLSYAGKAFSIARAPGDMEKAVENYTECIERDPSWCTAEADPRRERGWAYYFALEWDKAIADLSAAIERAPANYLPYFYRGACYVKKAEYPQAVADLSASIERNSEYAPAYYNRGKAYQAIGNHERAEADFKRAAQLDPANYGKR